METNCAMKTTFIFLLVLLLSSISGFSQKPEKTTISKDCVMLVEPSPFATPTLIENAVNNILTLSKVEFCSDFPFPLVRYNPLSYDWAEDAKRIGFYKFAQYAGRKQDANGRDLVQNVITDEMMDQLSRRVSPH